MDQITHAALASWQNFYVILGSSAGALTGLQFVVMTLITQRRAAANVRDIRAFGTPTVIHFCTALLISAVMTAPWQTLASLGLCIGACGVAGFVYSVWIIWHARKAAYTPDLADWSWYIAFPILGHAALVGAAVLVSSNTTLSLAIVAVDAIVFLSIGVHNSWDTVTFIAIGHGTRPSTEATEDRVDSAAR